MTTFATPKFHMLIVDDDPELGSGLKEFFQMKGYEVTLASDGEEALTLILDSPRYDIALLDVMLPKKSGFEVLQEIRLQHIDTPTLMLTGRGEQENILRGFGLGAADYIVKPFNSDELAARVRAILHRTQPPSKTPMEIYTIGDVEINFSTHEAHRDGDYISFTALEFDILRYLIENKGRTVSRKQLLRDVWGIEYDIITRTIDRHMASIRKKIETDTNNPRYIETVYGVGYRFNE